MTEDRYLTTRTRPVTAPAYGVGMASLQTRLGFSGEVLAAWWLERHGCRVVARNVRVEADEIDLIIDHHGRRVAIEVKLSTNGDDPLDAVDDAKFDRFSRAAAGLPEPVVRLDLLAVEVGHRGAGFRWLQGVW